MGVVLLLSRGVFAWFPIEHVSRCLIRSFNFVTFFVFGVVVFLGFVFVGWYVHSSSEGVFRSCEGACIGILRCYVQCEFFLG